MTDTLLCLIQRFGHRLSIVTDPLVERQLEPGWRGHALLEGLDRGSGDKRAFKALREAVAATLAPIED